MELAKSSKAVHRFVYHIKTFDPNGKFIVGLNLVKKTSEIE